MYVTGHHIVSTIDIFAESRSRNESWGNPIDAIIAHCRLVGVSTERELRERVHNFLLVYGPWTVVRAQLDVRTRTEHLVPGFGGFSHG